MNNVSVSCSRNEKKIQDLVVFPPRLKWEIWECCNFIPVLENARKQYEGNNASLQRFLPPPPPPGTGGNRDFVSLRKGHGPLE